MESSNRIVLNRTLEIQIDVDLFQNVLKLGHVLKDMFADKLNVKFYIYQMEQLIVLEI